MPVLLCDKGKVVCKIILVGFMGAGKSTVACSISDRTGKEVSDLDQLIEIAAGKSIPEIFRDGGEDDFRNLETKMLGALENDKEVVVATGGGIVGRPENWELMRRLGCIVYLRARWETLRARLEGSGDRPLLNQPNGWDEVRALFEKRVPLYEQADVIVDTDGRSLQEIAEEILRKVESWVVCRTNA